MVDEEIMQEMKAGKKDEDIETEEGREKLVEDDKISDVEQGFQKGFEEGDKMVKCANCGKLLVTEKFHEEEIEGETYRFCDANCAEEFMEKKSKGEKK